MNLNQYSQTTFGQAGDIQESTGFEPLPSGDYIVALTDASVKETKNNDGKFVEAEFTVVSENNSFVGRKIFHYFNFANKSQQAQQIGLGELKAMCKCARGELQPTEQFGMGHVIESLNRPIVVKVVRKNSTYQGETTVQNKIASFKAGFNALAQAQPQQQQPQQQGGWQSQPQQQVQQQPQQQAQPQQQQGGWQQQAQEVQPQQAQTNNQPAWNK